MKINFCYDRQKDIWCLLNKGKSSNNSTSPTKVYEILVSKYGENASASDVDVFIENRLIENKISIDEHIKQYTADWELVAQRYYEIAEGIFGVTLPHDITAYLTLNNRNPYNISENSFYVTIPRKTVRRTVMHELWHFYTWYGLGVDQEKKLGKQAYNDAKESLTVLLNEECADLMPPGVCDEGYPQHREIREEILVLWREQNDIRTIWDKITR